MTSDHCIYCIDLFTHELLGALPLPHLTRHTRAYTLLAVKQLRKMVRRRNGAPRAYMNVTLITHFDDRFCTALTEIMVRVAQHKVPMSTTTVSRRQLVALKTSLAVTAVNERFLAGYDSFSKSKQLDVMCYDLTRMTWTK